MKQVELGQFLQYARVPKMSVRDIYKHLSDMLTLKRVYKDFFGEVSYKVLLENAKGDCGHKDDLNLHFYHVIQDAKSDAYYQKHTVERNGEIFIVIDLNGEYFYSNNSLLFLETIVARGINQRDVEENTPELTVYLTFLYHYNNVSGGKLALFPFAK